MISLPVKFQVWTKPNSLEVTTKNFFNCLHTEEMVYKMIQSYNEHHPDYLINIPTLFDSGTFELIDKKSDGEPKIKEKFILVSQIDGKYRRHLSAKYSKDGIRQLHLTDDLGIDIVDVRSKKLRVNSRTGQ